MTGGDAGSPAGRDILLRLLDATPIPTPGSGIEELLETFEGILAERATIIAQLVPPLVFAAADRPLVVELEQRQALWLATLADARRAIGEQRCGADQLRAYAQTI